MEGLQCDLCDKFLPHGTSKEREVRYTIKVEVHRLAKKGAYSEIEFHVCKVCSEKAKEEGKSDADFAKTLIPCVFSHCDNGKIINARRSCDVVI